MLAAVSENVHVCDAEHGLPAVLLPCARVTSCCEWRPEAASEAAALPLRAGQQIQCECRLPGSVSCVVGVAGVKCCVQRVGRSIKYVFAIALSGGKSQTISDSSPISEFRKEQEGKNMLAVEGLLQLPRVLGIQWDLKAEFLVLLHFV